ncbi:MAG: type II toxin-antitoxin system VapC family toxin [Bacteroidia bacterium]
MSGTKLIVDTNIVLYLLNGDPVIEEMLQGNFLYISIITEMELLGFPGISLKEEASIKGFCASSEIININEQIKATAISFRKEYKLKLPDAIIAATSAFLGLPILTSDTAFKRVEDLPLLLYEPGNDISI